MRFLPKISVNIPVKSSRKPRTVLNSLKKVDYPANKIEIIVVQGQQIAKQRNLAVKNSTGQILYLLDDDSMVNPLAFKIIAKEFKNRKVAAVGGPSLTKKNKNHLNFLIGCALETYFGAMRMRLRYSNEKVAEGNEYHLIGANLALRKNIVKKIGMFNEKIVPNEETELLRRIKKAGYKLVYKKELFIRRTHRRNLSALAKQFHHYGIGRMKQILYNGRWEDFIFVLPVFFILYLLSLIYFHPPWFLLPLLCYLTLALITALKAAVKYRKISLLFGLPLIFPIIHISYASGLMREIISKYITQNKKSTNRAKFKLKVINLEELLPGFYNRSNLPR